MAGIGFELRKILKRESYLSLFQAYVYAGLISSGPWVLSILGVLIVGFLSLGVVLPGVLVTQFQVSVTYLIAGSLVATGFLQPSFTRYIADRLFERQDKRVLPGFHGALFLTTVASGVLGLLVLGLFFDGTSLLYRLFMLTGFVILCNIWITTIFLSGMKEYKAILTAFALGYGVVVLAALGLRRFGLEGLLGGFVVGHFVLLASLMQLTMRSYPSDHFIGFDFLKRGRMFPSLIWIGFLYNLGIWADKFMFWSHPDTREHVIGPLYASPIYDLPLFLAYLSIIPGMAVFLVRMETDFVEYYKKFYDAVRDGGTLEQIEEMRNEMVYTIRQGLFEIIKIQSIAVMVVFVTGPALLRMLDISPLHLFLLQVDVVGVGLQVVFLGLLNVFFYLDRRKTVLFLVLLFLSTNVLFTSVTLALGAPFYGYGFALALFVSVLAGMLWLDRKLETLEYETFMLQK